MLLTIRTNVLPIQIFINGSRRSSRILTQSIDVERTFLLWIVFGILLIAPVSSEIQPIHWRAVVVCCEFGSTRIETVVVSRQCRIPDWSSIAVIFDRSFRKVQTWNRVVVGAKKGVVGVSAVCGVYHGLETTSAYYRNGDRGENLL